MQADQPDLFPEAFSKSPRLAWLERHKLLTVQQQLPRLGIGPRNTMPWVCSNYTNTVAAFGEDELEATKRMAETMCIKHWEMEAYEAAISEQPKAEEEWG